MYSVRNITEAKRKKYTPSKVGVILNYSNFDDTGKMPRALVETDGTYTFQNHIDSIKERFKNDELSIVAVFGNIGAKILDKFPKGVTLVENENYKSLGDARSVGIGIRALNSDAKIIVIDATSIISSKSLNFDLSKSCVSISSAKPDTVGVNYDEKSEQIEMIMYGLKFDYSKIDLFIGKELELLKQICFDEYRYKLHNFELINEIIKNNGSFAAHKTA